MDVYIRYSNVKRFIKIDKYYKYLLILFVFHRLKWNIARFTEIKKNIKYTIVYYYVGFL